MKTTKQQVKTKGPASAKKRAFAGKSSAVKKRYGSQKRKPSAAGSSPSIAVPNQSANAPVLEPLVPGAAPGGAAELPPSQTASPAGASTASPSPASQTAGPSTPASTSTNEAPAPSTDAATATDAQVTSDAQATTEADTAAAEAPAAAGPAPTGAGTVPDDPGAAVAHLVEAVGGISIAVYDAPEGATSADRAEFRNRAEDFATQHHAFAVGGEGLVQNVAIPCSSIEAAAATIRQTVQAAREAAGNPAVRIQSLALFSHGFRNRLGLGDGIGPRRRDAMSTEEFAAALESLLGGEAQVILYACSTGSSARGDDAETGGEGSFADSLRDALNATGSEREVWGHTNAAHTTGNPNWRNFEGAQGGGRASTDLFGGVVPNRVRNRIRDHLFRGVAARMSESRRGRNAVAMWVAREFPFAQRQFPTFATSTDGRSFELTPGLAEWYSQRFLDQGVTSRDY